MTLRITVEVVPFGIEGRKRTLHVIEVENHGPYDHLLHSYQIKLDGLYIGTQKHRRDNGALRLARLALDRADSYLRRKSTRKEKIAP